VCGGGRDEALHQLMKEARKILSKKQKKSSLNIAQQQIASERVITSQWNLMYN
jgi:hypothetical protein